jgi:glycosyltransferase involved in cell wall biosynthesis
VRILFLNHNVGRRGGTFYRAFDVARYLVRRGHAVTLMTTSARRRWGFECEHREGVHMVYAPDLLWGRGRTGWDLWNTFNRLAYLRRKSWDIIHAWDSRPAVILPALFARIQSRPTNGKLVLDWCDWFGRGGTQAERPDRALKFLYAPVETYFEEAFRTRADASTVISKELYQRALKLGVQEHTIQVLPQGCDIETPKASDREDARQRLKLPVLQHLFVCVGALMPLDAEILFASLRILFNKRTDVLVAIIGRHGSQIPADLSKSPQLAETGFVPQTVLADYMAACNALVVPLADTLASRARWPSKVNPFLAAGRTVIITRVGDLAQLLERQNAGLVIAAQPEKIADGIADLMSDPSHQTEYEKRARQVAQNILDWRQLVAKLETLYMQVTAQNCSARQL